MISVVGAASRAVIVMFEGRGSVVIAHLEIRKRTAAPNGLNGIFEDSKVYVRNSRALRAELDC
jgi:hypothetical protein